MDSKKSREKSPSRPPNDERWSRSKNRCGSMRRRLKKLRDQQQEIPNDQADYRSEGYRRDRHERSSSSYRNNRHSSRRNYDYYPDEYNHKNDYNSDRYDRQWDRRRRNQGNTKWNSNSAAYGNLSWTRNKSSNPFKDLPEDIVNDRNHPNSTPFWFDINPEFDDREHHRDRFAEDIQLSDKAWNQNPSRVSCERDLKNSDRVSPVKEAQASDKLDTDSINKELPQEHTESDHYPAEEAATSSRNEEVTQEVSVKLEKPDEEQLSPQTKDPWNTNELLDYLLVNNNLKEEPTCPNSSEEQEPFRGFSNEFLQPNFEPLAQTPFPFIPPDEPTDSDLELANCFNVTRDNNFPTISLIPISRLIKSELKDLNNIDIITPTTPGRGKRNYLPNLVQRRKKSINDGAFGTLSENLVQRVANMDKVGIKNVINNSGTKYDAALKIQARKRLREEIRKQLKTMNFTPNENSENNVLVPDEIVDSMNIPAVVLDEIRKAFGIVLVEDMKVVIDPKKTDTPPIHQGNHQSAEDSSSKSPDLMTRLKMLEETKSQTEKITSSRSHSTPRKRAKSKDKDDVVVINSSSSSSSSSSSDSDSDSSASSTSTSSSYKRRKRKKGVLEANVVENFEKLILPNLSESQRRRYKQKYAKNVKSSLMYIYGVCVSRASRCNSTLDAKEKLKLKHNLSSSDNAQALEFLMTAILNLFEQHKEAKRQKDKEKETLPAIKPGNSSKRSNPISSSKKSKDSNTNSIDEQAERKLNKTASTAKTHQTNSKVDEVPSPRPPAADGVNRNDEDSIVENANSAQGALTCGEGDKLVVDNKHSDSESDLDDLPVNHDNPPSRQWKSPGEKKCIEHETSIPSGDIGLMQMPFGMNSLDLYSLKSQHSIGDEAVNSIREIDVKLMELHKRKMYIEEMILKLHKDKMEVDLCTMKLQNEKFILLNSALANASSNNSAPGTSTKTEKKEKTTEKRKTASPVIGEKPRSRKKHCGDKETPSTTKSNKQPRRSGRASTKGSSTSNNDKYTSLGVGVKTEAPTIEDTVIQASEYEPVPEPEPDKTVEEPQIDYTDVANGSFEGWKLPITQIIVVGEAIVAASEDGNIYKFNVRTRELESKFSKHTEAITQIFACPREKFVYTTSLDGFLKKTSVENFGLEIQSLNLQEPLQSIDIEWGTAFIGSRWGNIFTYDIKSNNLSEGLLCSSGSSIIAIKATKEGPRKILIVSSKGNQINFRDAMTGLLLRSLDVSENIHIYSILLDDGCVYCGTQRNEIHKYNFTTGGIVAIFHCGNGAVSMKLYKDKYIFVGCYDGFVYVLDKSDGCQIGRFPGSGKMILALEIAGDKIITSAKDNTMHIMDIPKYIVTKDKN